MEQSIKKAGFRDFNLVYWISVIYEFFERGAYYGMMSVLSIYMTDKLGFTKEGVGILKSTIQPLLYLLPIISGAIADKVGYRKTLMVAFSLLGLGYFLASQTTSYFAVFASLVVMAFGAGTFKPVISGTIARVTDERTNSLGFGIYYWSINLGAFLFPMFLIPYLKSLNWSYVILASAICTGAMLLPTIFIYKEPVKELSAEKERLGKVIKDILNKIIVVFKDWRFILFIFIYSWFWIMYFQMFDSVLWYVESFVDASPLNNFVLKLTGINWHFDVEHVTVINALTIILLQLIVSSIVKKTKALPTMITGISFAIVGMAILAINTNIWIFIIGVFIFSIGEMTAHPKFLSYLGMIAPADKKATYQGFGFLYGVFGSLIGGILGAFLYVRLIDNPMIAFIRTKLAEAGSSIKLPQGVNVSEAINAGESIGLTKAQISMYAHPSELWLLFCGIGVVCIIGLLIYQKFIGARKAADLN